MRKFEKILSFGFWKKNFSSDTEIGPLAIFSKKNVVFRAYHKLDAAPPERIGRWEQFLTDK